MNKCTDIEIQELLPDLVHGSLDEHAKRAVDAHLVACESCREDLAVIQAVKSAAIFAPRIDADRVASQIPPYRMVVPGVEEPKRSRMVSWLVAAGLALAVVGGGSLVMSNQSSIPVTPIAGVIADSNTLAVAPPESVKGIASPESKTTVTTEVQPHALALAANVDELSDGNLQQLMTDMDEFDALPPAEPELVLSVDSGDSL
jgi:anti-sigma factor RsiW